MKLQFNKYQGTGNDFVMLDNRSGEFNGLTIHETKALCDRRFGIGADGLILLENTAGYDFKMVYYNADGNESSMCGNGGRCIVKYARQLNIITDKAKFMAIDGEHLATINNDHVKLKMNDVKHIDKFTDALIMNTGSPHYVQFVEHDSELNVYEHGKLIRYSEEFAQEGINVNFVEIRENDIYVRTYERGVEDETLSCGTGCTASAIAYHSATMFVEGIFAIPIHTPGGELKVYFSFDGNIYSDIWLEGIASSVFEGVINI